MCGRAHLEILVLAQVHDCINDGVLILIKGRESAVNVDGKAGLHVVRGEGCEVEEVLLECLSLT